MASKCWSVSSKPFEQRIEKLNWLGAHNTVPGHFKILGNDSLARRGAEMPVLDSSMPLNGPDPVLDSSMKLVKFKIRLMHQQHSLNSDKYRQPNMLIDGPNNQRSKTLLKPKRTVCEMVVELMTEHCSLNRHLLAWLTFIFNHVWLPIHWKVRNLMSILNFAKRTDRFRGE